jgi:hypothetical protein
VIQKEDGKEIWVTLFFDGRKVAEAIRNENQTKTSVVLKSSTRNYGVRVYDKL